MKNDRDTFAEPSLLRMTCNLDYVANDHGGKIDYAENNERCGSCRISYEEET